MDRLSSDLLLSILGGLDSKEMCKCRRVSKRWSEVIDGSKSNWRELIVSDKIQDWKPSMLEEFDQKSGNSIKVIDIKIGILPNEMKRSFLKTLCKSSKSLSTLFISSQDSWMRNGLSFKIDGHFPNLTDLRLVNTTANPHDNVQLIKREKVEVGKLRILWVDCLDSSNLEILSHLTSLTVQEPKRQKEFRQILEGPSQTLKHLQIGFVDSEPEIKPLHFPRLELLELIRCLHGFPSWFKISSTSKVISDSSDVPRQLPNCSELWLGGIFGYPNLENRVPSLQTLRLKDATTSGTIQLLSNREKNVKAGLKVDGIKMSLIKKIVIPFKRVVRDQMVDLEDLVDEVVDYEQTLSFVRVEI